MVKNEGYGSTSRFLTSPNAPAGEGRLAQSDKIMGMLPGMVRMDAEDSNKTDQLA